MASGFRDLDTVARFATLRWPNPMSQPHWLLWPMWFRRVATPTKAEEGLGPFERAVLNCARAGITDSHHIGDLLLIDRRLVEVIQSSMREKGSLAPSLALTTEGLAALEAGTINSAEIRTVYSFTCALTGALLPRFSEQLFFADTKVVDRRIQIAHQTEGDDRFYPCFKLLPPVDAEPSAPLADDVLRAALRHALDRRGATADEHRERSAELLPLAPQLNRVHIIDQFATPVFVATIVCRDPNPLAAPGSIVVADPFGLGTTRKLRDELLRFRSVDRATNDWIERITRPASGETKLVEDHREDWDLCASEASSRLGLEVPHAAVVEQLTAVELALLQSGRTGVPAPQRQRLLKQAGQAGRDALEAGFITLAARYPLTAIVSMVEQLRQGDQRLIQSMLKEACRDLGFPPHLPHRFFRVRVGDLRSVVCYQHFSKLAAVVAASLLVAKRHSVHPFRRLAKRWPEFLTDTELALEVAGEAAHHQEQGSTDQSRIVELRDYAYECLRALLSPNEAHRILPDKES